MKAGQAKAAIVLRLFGDIGGVRVRIEEGPWMEGAPRLSGAVSCCCEE